jgi:hypothetical protein
MSANLDVSSAGLSSPPPSPLDDSTGGAASSAAGQESSSDASTQTAGGVTAATNGQDNSGDVNLQTGSAAPAQDVDPLEGVPTLEELSQNQSQPYAKALHQLRPAYEALKSKYGEVEPLAQFKDVVQNSTPEQLKAKLDIVDGFFSPVLRDGQQVYENGLPVTTARPGLEKLVAESPDTLFQIIEDALPLAVDGHTMEARLTHYLLQKHGLNPANLGQYAEWEKTGAPVATAAVDLSNVPQQFHEVFKTLPPAVQQDIVNAEPDAREHYLKREQQAYEVEKAKQEAVQTQAREAQATVQRNTHTAVMGKFETGFNRFLQHLSGWKPTADDAVNRAYHIETASTLVNLLDPNMAFANRMLYETLGIQPDAEIPQLSQQFQQQLGLAELYKARGDQMNAANAQRSADSATCGSWRS